MTSSQSKSAPNHYTMIAAVDDAKAELEAAQRKSVGGPGEEDGPWAEGWDQRRGGPQR
jgi:hypothetical protein